MFSHQCHRYVCTCDRRGVTDGIFLVICDTSLVTGGHLWHRSLHMWRFYTVIYWRGYFTVDWKLVKNLIFANFCVFLPQSFSEKLSLFFAKLSWSSSADDPTQQECQTLTALERKGVFYSRNGKWLSKFLMATLTTLYMSWLQRDHIVNILASRRSKW